MDNQSSYEPVARTLRKKREALISGSTVENADDFMRLHTRIIDEYFLESFERSMVGPRLKINRNPYAIIALGGYGRKEQCVNSDVDILFLFRKKVPAQAEELIREILYPLWDVGLDVGHAVRSLKECVSLAASDVEVLTSVMDARFICGMSPLCSLLAEQIRKKVLSRGAKKIVMELIETTRARRRVFGDASYLLEPDLKEGRGGLRDYHGILWLARIKAGVEKPRDLEYLGLLSHDEYAGMQKALSFIRSVRNRLHLLTGRKCDRLHFEYQRQMARVFGFEDRDGQKGVERFLGTLQGHMETVGQLHRMFVYELENACKPKKERHRLERPVDGGFELKRGMLTFSTPEKVLESPESLIRIFEESARTGIPLFSEAKRIVADFGRVVDDGFIESKTALASFENILSARVADFDVLDDMLHSGFLMRFIPELSCVLNRIEFDSYHHYPVDKHLLLTLKNVKELGEGEKFPEDGLFRCLYGELGDKVPLLWAALLHDIGKCDPEKDHSEVGARIAAEMLRKRGYSENVAGTVSFLVREHLLLKRTAARRDIEDEKTAISLAREIGDEDRLKMLYLLTAADLTATGKGAWCEWTLSLLRDLFMKVLRILKNGELATEQAAREVEEKKRFVLDEAGGERERAARESVFEILSPRYLLYTPAEDIAGHIELYEKLKDRQMVWKIEKCHSTDTRTATICAKDAPGLFSRLAGLFALHNMDILEAQAYTWRNGVALDIFKVRPPLDKIFEDEKWASAEKDLKAVLEGKLDLAEALGAKFFAAGGAPEPMENELPPKVHVDNESSSFFTIIEVHACDEPGLLFRLADAIYRKLNLDIWIAKASAGVDQIVDVFYVRDMYGQKIKDDDQVATIKTVLENVLRAVEGAGVCVT